MDEKMNPDSEATYDAEIAPLMTKIIEICKTHRIPMLACFQYHDAEQEDGAGFCTTRLPFVGDSMTLTHATQILMAKSPPAFGVTITTYKPPVD